MTLFRRRRARSGLPFAEELPAAKGKPLLDRRGVSDGFFVGREGEHARSPVR